MASPSSGNNRAQRGRSGTTSTERPPLAGRPGPQCITWDTIFLGWGPEESPLYSFIAVVLAKLASRTTFGTVVSNNSTGAASGTAPSTTFGTIVSNNSTTTAPASQAPWGNTTTSLRTTRRLYELSRPWPDLTELLTYVSDSSETLFPYLTHSGVSYIAELLSDYVRLHTARHLPPTTWALYRPIILRCHHLIHRHQQLATILERGIWRPFWD
ncbi:hypothetical protein F4821DRAFT_265485 [Hypoxylon rubiginosum]|uniref:Uncharacterized protein n=1 Tax=Hypoxylon rubiginosum TaxID=110542 RepID=A0ACC0CKG3_9PEZI|nr:hypothetical protein F4821DRAFT_265485 [Hypoxylon rubiginosum]